MPNFALTNKEFLIQAGKWAGGKSVQTANTWWAAFQEVVVREIFYTGSCRVPGIGTFSTRTVSEQLQTQKDPNTGETVVYKVPERVVPIFTPEDDFINDINNQGVTKAFRKRLKSNTLSQRDYERQVRAESMNVVGSLSAKRIEKSKKEFEKLLNEKKKKYKGKIETNENEDE